MFCLVLGSHGSEGPIKLFELCKTGGFGQEIFLADGQCKGWVFSLKEKDHGIDGGDIIVLKGYDTLDIWVI